MMIMMTTAAASLSDADQGDRVIEDVKETMSSTNDVIDDVIDDDDFNARF